MREEIQSYLGKYNEEIQDLFIAIRELIIKSTLCEIEEKMWAKLPSFYVKDKFIRVIPFKDHVNIQTPVIIKYKSQLEQYRITPQGMLQIYLNQEIPYDILQLIFMESLIQAN